MSRDSAALMSATPRRLNVSINEARSTTLRVQRSSLAISTAHDPGAGVGGEV